MLKYALDQSWVLLVGEFDLVVHSADAKELVDQECGTESKEDGIMMLAIDGIGAVFAVFIVE